MPFIEINITIIERYVYSLKYSISFMTDGFISFSSDPEKLSTMSMFPLKITMTTVKKRKAN